MDYFNSPPNKSDTPEYLQLSRQFMRLNVRRMRIWMWGTLFIGLAITSPLWFAAINNLSPRFPFSFSISHPLVLSDRDHFLHSLAPWIPIGVNLYLFLLLPIGIGRSSAKVCLQHLQENNIELSRDLITSSASRQFHVNVDPMSSFALCAEITSSIIASEALCFRENGVFRYDPFSLRLQIGRWRPFFLCGAVSVQVMAEPKKSSRITVRYRAGLIDFVLARENFRRIHGSRSSDPLIGEAFYAVENITQVLTEGFHRRQIALDAITRERELERAALEAKLATLQAQVEPHFLFNTLANLKYLIRTDADSAQTMVDHLVGYLQSALPDMRSASSSVRRELELARHYLTIMQIRMGQRLRFLVDAADDVLDAALPPSMLISLVENAVKHGLERATRPGEIVVQVCRDGTQVLVSVSDDGIGLHEQAGQGFGLANIHERLKLLYGDAASLIVAPSASGGVVASLRIPILTSETR